MKKKNKTKRCAICGKYHRNKRVFADICKEQFFVLPAIGITNSESTGFRIAFGWLCFLLSIRICRAIGTSEERLEDFDEFDLDDFAIGDDESDIY